MSEVNRPDVAGIGSMVVDRLHRVPRIVAAEEKGPVRPLPGGELVQSAVGGVVLNHLGWAAVLGLRTAIFGQLPEDAGGRFLREGMGRLGIAPRLEPAGSHSAVADIYVDDAGQRAIYFASGATAETTPEHVRTHHAGVIAAAGRVTSEVHQLPLASVLETLRLAREAGVPSLLDVDMPPSAAVPALGSQAELDAVLAAADILKPSKAAAREWVPDAADDAQAVARALRERFGSEAVIVTDGERGAAVSAASHSGAARGFAVTAVDTTGAGDAFLGGLLTALHHELAWPDALRLANAAGAACAEQLGAFPADAERCRARVLELYDGAKLSLAPLPQAVASSARPDLHAFDVTLDELTALRRRTTPEALDAAQALVREAVAKGARLHVTGIGKCEHVARYAASLLASTGTPAVFLHGTEASHGSAGQVVAGDVVVAISNSGETGELRAGVTAARALGARILAITGGRDSWLARHADALLDAGVAHEGGPLDLAPRASAAAQLVVLAAFSAGLQAAAGFSREDYHARHPGGELGKRSR